MPDAATSDLMLYPVVNWIHNQWTRASACQDGAQ
jgi:hypothetical protein